MTNIIQYMNYRKMMYYNGEEIVIIDDIPIQDYSNSSNTPSNPSPPETTNHTDYYIKGAFSGMFGILLSHPIDTIKTHIQTGKPLSTFKFNITNLYKGLSAPLFGVGIEKAIVFGTYNYFQKQTASKLGSASIPVSGAIAGLTAALVVSPYERLKILKQNSQKIMFSDLSPSFMFKGLSATFTREVPGFAIYFSVYEALKYNTFTKYNCDITYLHSFLYGGLSGITAWLFIYPQDRIKTILQANANSDGRFSNVMREIYAKGGIKHFYSGFSWAVMRAMLLHSGTFCMMEVLTSGVLNMDMLFTDL